MKTSANGIELIKEFEGLRLWWYDDGGGNPTIGYGHMSESKSLPDGMCSPLTEETATQLLALDLTVYENIVINRFANSGVTLNQNQFDALVSFAYNLGEISNGLYNAIIGGYDADALKTTFRMYSKMTIGGVFQTVKGLLDRRVEEWELYMTPVEVAEPKPAEPALVLDNTPDDWARTAVENAIAKKILLGDEHGNLKLHTPVTRQELLVILARADVL